MTTTSDALMKTLAQVEPELSAGARLQILASILTIKELEGISGKLSALNVTLRRVANK